MLKRIVWAIVLSAVLILSTTAFGAGSQAPAALAAPLDGQRINFPLGSTSYTLSSSLAAGVPQSYVLGIGAGQTLYLTLYGGVTAQVLDGQGHSLAGPSGQMGPWGVTVPGTGDYTVTLAGSGAATVVFYIPPLLSPTPWPLPWPTPLTRISFARGASSATFGASLVPGIPAGYLLRLGAGQRMYVNVNGSAAVSLLDPWGRPVQPASSGSGQWQFPLSWSGDYQLTLTGSGPVGVTVYVPPLAPLPAATRIRFAPGNASASLTANLPARYILRIMGGQTMYIQVADESATVAVTGPYGAVNTMRSGRPGLWVAAGRYSGDYIISIQGTGTTGLTVYVPPL